MRVRIARHTGYCFGVRRAMDLAFGSLERSPGPVYSHGPMIHNRQAMEILAKRGLRPWPEDPGVLAASDFSKSTVIIRAHGLAPEAEKELRATGVSVIDATCPRVSEVQRLVAREAENGSSVIIWGAAGHPEVEGLLGYAGGRGLVLAKASDAALLPDLDQVTLVAQTTQNVDLWPEVVRAVQERFPDLKALNTICQATVNRQSEARRLSSECEALVVVGDRHSGNTRRLYEIALARGLKCVSVEGPGEIKASFVDGLSDVGLVSGASTPDWQSRLVRQRLVSLDRASQKTPLAFALRLLRALVLSNIFVGLGAGCLGWAMAGVLGYKLPAYLFGLFFFFCQAMHLMNGYLDLNAARYNDLDRADFLVKYQPYLFSLGVTSLFLSLTAALLAGPYDFWLIAVLSLLAFLYAFRWPVSPLRRWGIWRIKDAPFSKSICMAVGWAILLIFPAFFSNPPFLEPTPANVELGFWALVAVLFQLFARCLRMDFQDSIGDRIFGRRTAVTVLGWRWAARLLKATLVLWAFFLAAASVRCPGAPFPFLMVSGPMYNMGFMPDLVKKGSLSGFVFDALLDFQFLLAAMMVTLWDLI
jgi:4-hydroxy-3-methylbut-2-enyl diphosphate reductase